MTINSLNRVSSVQGSAAVERTSQTVRIQEKDSVAVSSEAKTMGEVYAAAEELRNLPDVRTDKVEAARTALKDPDYMNRASVETVAEKMLNLFGI